MNPTLRAIIDGLKQYGDHENGSPEYCFQVKDEPFMAFDAEWHEARPGTGVLYLSYSFIQNSDVCCDPLLGFFIENNELVRISYDHWLGLFDGNVIDDPYPLEFAELVWRRHMKDRLVNAEAVRSNVRQEDE